jgi:hypothetical protein
MEIIEHALIILAMIPAIAWPAVFVVVLIDKLRGRSIPSFFGGVGRHHFLNRRPLTWWQIVLLSPVFLLGLAFIAILWLVFAPPMYIIEWPARLKARKIKP